MRAFVIHSAHTAAVEERPVPRPAPGEALVRVTACGVCGSDLHAYEGTQPFFQYPEVPGHEVVGVIDGVRPGLGDPMRLPGRPIEEGLQPGERVVLDPGMPCGACYPCTHGRYNCCERMRVIGVHAPGALAEYYCAPLECLHRVPAGLTDDLAALVEPLSIGVQASTRGRIGEQDRVLVIGAGTIGLCVMLIARSRGAKVALSDLSASRRAKALEMGADAALNPEAPDFRERLEGFAEDTGPSVVVEAVGIPATVAQALDLVVASGRVVLLGLVSRPISFPGNVMVKKELDFMGSRLHCGTVPAAARLIAEGQVDVAPLLTHRVGLDGAQDCLRLMAGSPDQILKAVVSMGA